MIRLPTAGDAGRSDAGYFLLALVVGALGGSIGTAFHVAVEGLLGASAWLAETALPLALKLAVSIAAAAVAATAAALLVRRIAPEAAGSGIQEIEGAMEGLRPLRPVRVLVAKFLGGVFALGAGLVLGREGPTIHMGAASAELLTGRLKLDWRERKGLIAAGAAAGLAAAFNAPLAAVLFIVEETRRQFPYGYRTYIAVIVAAATAAIITEGIAGVGPALEIAAPAVPLPILPMFVVLGILLGALGVTFNAALVAALDISRGIAQRHWWLPPLAVGALAGALLVLAPDATRGGESLIEGLIIARYGVLVLLGLTALRLIGVLSSYASGVPGGIFAPMLSIATCFGLAFGVTLEGIAPDVDHLPAACAVAAMGGLFAASVRAPLVGVVLVLELTGAYELLLPVLITCAGATVTAEKLGGRPIYEVLLERTLRLAGEAQPTTEEKTPVQLGIEDSGANASLGPGTER